MKRVGIGAALATILAFSGLYPAYAGNPLIEGSRSVKVVDDSELGTIKGSGYYANYYGYYGQFYAYYAYQYATRARYSTGAAADYYNAYYFGTYAGTNLYYAYVYASYGL